MKGCLFVLVLGVGVLAAVAWFGGPPIAGAVVTTTLTAGGLTAATLDVDVNGILRTSWHRFERISGS